MKRFSFILILAAIALPFLLSSCNEKTEGDIFDVEEGVHAAFASTVQVVDMVSEDGNKILVPIMRGGKSNVEANVEISLTYAASIPAGTFTLANNVINFPVGANVAYAQINYADINQLGAGTIYNLTLQIVDEEQLSVSKADKITVKAQRKLTYVPIGTGTYYSEFDEDSWAVNVEKALEAEVYKIKNCYVNGFDIVFSVAGDNSISIPMQPSGYTHSTYGIIYFDMARPADPQPYKNMFL